MNEAPEVPAPPPEVPKNKLWASLAVPPATTLILTILIGLFYNRIGYGQEFLVVLPVSFFTILICLRVFTTAWKVRYRGRSLQLTCAGYFLGQLILCLGLWFGGCFLILS